MATASWTYFARRGSDSKVVRISRDRAQSLIRSPARSHTTNPTWLVVWEVPPKYSKEALWRVESGWIAPSWVYHRGGLVGGVYRSNSQDVEPHPPHRTAGSVRAKDKADLRFARHELKDAAQAVRRVERRHGRVDGGVPEAYTRRFRLSSRGSNPHKTGWYKYGPGLIWISGGGSLPWWATARLTMTKEKDFEARTFDAVMTEATRWIDMEVPLARTRRVR